MTQVAGRGRAVDEEGGFTLIEVIIALTVVFGALASLAYVGTASLTDIAIAKSRRAATSLADQALEQIRALPYDTVAKGLDNADLATMSDPAITQSGGEYFYDGELIPRGDNPAIEPLVPHQSTVTLDEVDYTVSTYVTYYAPDTTGKAYRVSVVVSWLNHLRGTQVKRMEAQTVVYAGAACQSPANHPFPAPCQPFFYVNGSVAPGGITITKDVLEGYDLGQADLLLPHQSSDMTIEQSTSVLSKVSTSATTYRQSTDTADSGHLEAQAQAYADNDPSSAGRPEYDSSTTATSDRTPVTFGATGNNITLNPSNGDAGDVRSGVAATLSNACPDLGSPAVVQTDGRACGHASASLGGSLSAVLAVDRLGSATLASLSGATSASYTKRIGDAGAAVCTATPDGSDGCAHATARRSVAAFTVGGGFSGLSAPSGFTSLVKASNLSTTASAEAGWGAASSTVSRSGTIEYWNGTGYTSLSLTNSAVDIPVTSVTMSNPSNGDEVTISGTLRTGTVGAPSCASPCPSAAATAESPIVGTVRYVVVRGGITVADLTIRVDLGALEASATYIASQ